MSHNARCIERTLRNEVMDVPTTNARNPTSLPGATSSLRAFTILIDGLCPLCAREARFMARLDKGRGRLRIIDIAGPSFRASDYGTTQEAVMGTIHGVREDGTLVTGMDVFRLAYAAVGWPWLLGWTGWRIVRPLADAAYRVFARNRLRWTGRCADGACKVSAE